jgi:acetyltransferase-like isoleucine patch superfamily enzyme
MYNEISEWYGTVVYMQYIYSGIQIPKHVVIPRSVHIYKLPYKGNFKLKTLLTINGDKTETILYYF